MQAVSTVTVFEEDCAILRRITFALIHAQNTGDAKRATFQRTLARKHLAAMEARHGEAATEQAVAQLLN